MDIFIYVLVAYAVVQTLVIFMPFVFQWVFTGFVGLGMAVRDGSYPKNVDYIEETAKNMEETPWKLLSNVLLAFAILHSTITALDDSIWFNEFMANYYIKNEKVDDSIEHLEFIVLKEEDDSKKISNYHKAVNIFSANNYMWKVDDISQHMIDKGYSVPSAFYFRAISYWKVGLLYEDNRYLSHVSDIYPSEYSQLQDDILEFERLEKVAFYKQIASLVIPDSPWDLVPGVKYFKSAKKLKKLSSMGKKVKLSRSALSNVTVKGERKIKKIRNNADNTLKKYNTCVRTNGTGCEEILEMDVSV